MYSEIIESLNRVIQSNVPDAVLFSGGIDSSCILYESKKYNKNVKAIVVGVKENNNSDIMYSKLIADKLNVQLNICTIDKKYILSKIDDAIKIMKTFNPQWISSTITLLVGIEYSKKMGLKKIASGEGSDDLFASFPFFIDFNGTKSELDNIVNMRIEEIDMMTSKIAAFYNLISIVPFRNHEIQNLILSIPIEERIKKKGFIKTKYPLRCCYESFLPEETINRPQTMAFKGSGIYEVVESIADDISEEEYIDANNKIFCFNSKLEYALFKRYIKFFNYEQSCKDSCIHCKSNMGNYKVNCMVCQTVQFNGKEIIELKGQKV